MDAATSSPAAPSSSSSHMQDPSSSHATTTQRGRTGYAYSAIGTLSSAFSGLWYRGPVGASEGEDVATIRGEPKINDAAPAHSATTASNGGPSSSSYAFPGGWATGYFTRPSSKPAKPSAAAAVESPSGRAAQRQLQRYDDEEDEEHDRLGGSPSPAWRQRSSTAMKKRGPLPFDLQSSGHSRTASVDSKGEGQSASSSPRPAPLHTQASDRSAVATLTRLKAQSSRTSLRSTFDAGGRYEAPSSSASASSWFFSQHGGDHDAASSSAFTPSSSSTPAATDAAAASIRPGAPPPTDWREALARTTLLDSYVQSIVYQSGIDESQRPIVILSSSSLPDAKLVDYDALLTRIMDTMELFVQNDYTVVFFAGGATHRPPWNWIWSAYKRLSRDFRKNIRRLYICHPTFFTRSLVQIVSTGSAVLSPKFARKITVVKTLSELAKHVDLTQMDVPPHVYEWNLRYEKEVVVPEKRASAAASTPQPATSLSPSAGVFGVPLTSLMGERGELGGIPRVVRDCVEDLLRLNGRALDSEGLFRKSPSSSLLRLVQAAYDRGQPVSLEKYDDPHMAAALLKLFFRSLPEPIFPASTYATVRSQCPPIPADGGDGEKMHEVIAWIRASLIPLIEPSSKLLLFSYVVDVLHKASLRAHVSKMDANNLATVWAPNFVRSNDAIKDMSMCLVAAGAAGGQESQATLGTIIKICIERYYEIFEFDYHDYEPPTTCDLFFTAASSSSPPRQPPTMDDTGSATIPQSPRRAMAGGDGGQWTAAESSAVGKKGPPVALRSPASFLSAASRRSSATRAPPPPSAWSGHNPRFVSANGGRASLSSSSSPLDAEQHGQSPKVAAAARLRSPASSSSLRPSSPKTTTLLSPTSPRRPSVPPSPAASGRMRSPSSSMHSSFSGAQGGLGLALAGGRQHSGLGNPLGVGKGRSASGSLRLISSSAKLRGASSRLPSSSVVASPTTSTASGGGSAGLGSAFSSLAGSSETPSSGEVTPSSNQTTTPSSALLFAPPSGAALTGAEALGAFFVNNKDEDGALAGSGEGGSTSHDGGEEQSEELADECGEGEEDGDGEAEGDQTFLSTAETLSPPRVSPSLRSSNESSPERA
ncbi:hypothetical protein BDZ90DRAFT_230796 [Jaminaea rosea]|uniref:Rho-GAP domain-containing protein n=1 Tax=Jaminaea rosea TaxID=1569628 RepID=A0A316UU24_9BASI|nr:hypothetical protein BDZ90DRAFT_230796 [Jaminaea rosea]PWN28789.1 hypothetical protein BDZ90DRAFT_230796 [Jaminaea rosea]